MKKKKPNTNELREKGEIEVTCQGTCCVVLRVTTHPALRCGSAPPSPPLCYHRAVTVPAPQEQDWQTGWQVPTGLRASPQLHTSMAVPVTQSRRQVREHPAWKSTFPSPRCQAGSSAAQHSQQPGLFLQEKVAFAPRAETFGYLAPLSTPSLTFLRIFSKAFEKLQVPQMSHFSALKGSGLVEKKRPNL